MRSHITYRADPHPEGLEATDVPDGMGACSAVIIGSILYPPNGGYSLAMMSLDGRTGAELDDGELWKLWSMVAHRLSESTTLSATKRELCSLVFETVKIAVLASREAARNAEDEPDAPSVQSELTFARASQRAAVTAVARSMGRCPGCGILNPLIVDGACGACGAIAS